MPLCWRGLAIFPDGLGPVLDAAIGTARDSETDLHRELTEMLLAEAQGIWASMREELAPAPPQRLEARQRRAIVQIKGPAGGLPRLAYTLNPLTPCASPLLNGRWITHVRDIAPALDAVATASPAAELVEQHIAAFIGARSERRLDQEVKGLAANGQEADRALSALRLLSALQQQYHPAPLMGLTAWISPRARALVERWKNRERRAEIEEQLKSLTSLGFLAPILALLADSAGQAADSEGLRAARAEVSRLDAELRGIAGGAPRRAAQAGRMGQEIAAGLGLLAVTVTLILAALG
jgi:hypothetical protein